MVRFKQGRKVNPGRIRKAAWKAGVMSPLGCTLAELGTQWCRVGSNHRKSVVRCDNLVCVGASTFFCVKCIRLHFLALISKKVFFIVL